MTRPLICLALCVFGAVTASAWDAKGHQIIGEIAFRKLTPEAKAEALRLLRTDDDQRYHTFYQATVWADDIKGETREFDAWHYVNFFQGQSNEKPLEPNVLTAIDLQTKVLKDPRQGVDAKRRALKWLLHLIGDVHQPLHASSRMVNGESDRGGNGFTLDREHRNLHSYWDKGLTRPTTGMDIAKSADYVTAKAKDITGYAEHKPDGVKNMNPRDWAMESFAFAKKYLYTTPMDQAPGTAYQKTASEISILRGQLAGERLAAYLNDLFKKEEK